MSVDTATSTPTTRRGIDPVAARYDRPFLFYGLATAIPWACWFAAAYLSNLDTQTATVQWWTAALSLAGLLAPLAVLAGLVARRPELRADVLRRMRWPRKAPPAFITLAFLIAPASILAATAVSLLFGYSPEQFLPRGGYTFTAGLLPVWVTLVGAAIIEEIVWHGYGTDTLVRRMRVFSASMLFTVLWALWHLPLGFIEGYYHEEVVDMGWIHTLNFPVSIVAFVVVMNWLYYRAGRSILVPVVFHLTANFANEVLLTDPDTKLIQTLLLLAFATVVVVKDRALFFARP
ncbi:type II CAAX endopeptidase family protein [Glycomyces albus]